MKILIAPIAALAETKGPTDRARALAMAAKARGHEPAFCAAEDVNYRPIDGVPNFFAPVPSPFGTPLFIGKRVFGLVQKLGLQQHKTVHSFEEVLHIAGASARRFFPRDVEAIRQAIRQLEPHVVYAAFRPAAIVAAKLEGVPVVTGAAYPASAAFAKNPEHGAGVRAFLAQHDLPAVESALELFDWAEHKFVASSPDLEPLQGDNVHHVGPMVPMSAPDSASLERRNIIAYMGNGTISPKRLERALIGAFADTDDQVYIASQGLAPAERGNIHVAPRFDFGQLMPAAQVFINHGGQNSVMTGLIHGVPQIVCPGKIFERRYNAQSVAALQAGAMVEPADFDADALRRLRDELLADPSVAAKARDAGAKLLALGGADRVIDILEQRYGVTAAGAGDQRALSAGPRRGS